MSEIARCVMSMPIHARFSFCAAWTAVPQPQNGSRTISPSLELAADDPFQVGPDGFWVG